MSGSTILVGLVVVAAFGLLVVVHELGHFLAARACGMRVERFSVGFGPVILRRRSGDTEWVISAFPFGGYVRIAGMAPGEDDPSDDRLFSSQPAWRRFLVILAGPAMNYLAAIAVAWGLVASIGLPAPDPAPRVGALVEGMPAAVAGLRTGDEILAVAGVPVGSWKTLVAELQRHPGERIVLEVARGGASPIAIPITPRDDGGVGRVGFAQAATLVRAGPAGALAEGFERTNRNAASQLAAFASLFKKRPSAEGAVGPAGIVQQLMIAAREGAGRFLGFVWTISVVLAILNLLPVPALDGGRLVFLGYEIVSRRRVNEKVESYVHLAGFVLLVGLILAVTIFGDLPRLLRR